jgi:hypothetical protein
MGIEMSNYTYDVFISYRHNERDRAWAKWLLEALETYRVPKGLQHRGFPPRVGKAFRDEDELPTSVDLSANIQQALEGSKFLVVICSKDTPSSLWVDKEIQTFRALGKGDHIIPMLVDGTPETTFPPALLTLKKPVKQADGTIIESDEPLESIAADVRPRTDEKLSILKRLALLRILSAILGCAFDDLRQRDKARETRKKRITYSIAAGLLLLVVGGSLYLWDYNRLKVAYYNTVFYRWGVPEGVGKLTSEMIKHKEIHFRIANRRRRVVETVRQNSAGLYKDDDTGESQWLPFYRADGNIDRLVVKDHNHRILMIKKYVYGESEKGTHPDSVVVQLGDAQMNPYHQRSTTMLDFWGMKSVINRYLVNYNRDGFVTELRFQNIYGRSKSDITGKYGQRFEVDPFGLIVRQADLGIDGQPMPSPEGPVWTMRQYDRLGCLVEERYTDKEGKAVPCREGYQKRVVNNDVYGNQIDITYLDANNDKIITSKGYSHKKIEFDQNGFPACIIFSGPDGKPKADINGVAKNVQKHDRFGNTIEKSYFGPAGKPVLNQDSIATQIYSFDTRGNIIEFRSYGIKGEPVINKHGVFQGCYAFDQKGRMIGFSYFGIDGKPSKPATVSGTCKMNLQWDERDYATCLETFTLDSLGAYVLIMKTEIEFDERGNAARLKIEMPGEGMQDASFQYDEAGNCLVLEEYDYNGKIVSKQVYTYDKQGHRIQESNYGLNNELVDDESSGYARMVIAYDSRGMVTDTTYYNTRGKTVKPKK